MKSFTYIILCSEYNRVSCLDNCFICFNLYASFELFISLSWVGDFAPLSYQVVVGTAKGLFSVKIFSPAC